MNIIKNILSKIEDWFLDFNAYTFFIFSVIIGGAGMIIAVIVDNTPASKYRLKNVEYIYSINREKNISGHFAIGSGRINSVDYYYFYKNVNQKNNHYILDKIETQTTTIIESNIDEPTLDTYQYCLLFCKKFYHINVPTGSIIQKINL